MEKIQTAKEYLKKLDEESGTIWTEDDESICNALKDFAKLHVEAALKAAAENADLHPESNCYCEGGYCSKTRVDEDSILNAYPLSNIQ